MKKHTYFIAICLIAWISLPFAMQAQEKERSGPVWETFSSGLIGDQQSIETPYEDGLEFLIHHRFGTIETYKDVFGLYAPSNIRLGLDYGFSENLMAGFGYEKNNKLLEFHGKYRILRQTQENEMPVSVGYYVNVAADLRNEEVFGENYGFANRMSYFHQLIIARKFGERIGVQLSPSYSHFNATDSIYQHDHLALSLGARVKVYNEISLILNYSQPMPITLVRYYQADHFPKPNLGIGFEIATGTHSFQLFAANYDKITPQKNLAYNMNAILDGQFLVGMNVLVRF